MENINDIIKHREYMLRCIQLAKNGIGYVAPNPMVGSVIVYNDKIIGEGFHAKYGESHAEVNAIESVKDKSLLTKSTIYVSLEPCNHYGKTPPCTDLIIMNKIPNVVIASMDTNPKVNGKGIKKLKDAGCNVITGIMENEALNLNKRFFTFHNKKRPYIILKWVQTIDGFIDIIRNNSEIIKKPNWITNEYLRILVHKWRTEEQAIMVGTNTVINDNPQLNVRNFNGKNPLRISLDKDLKIPASYHLLDKSLPTIIYTSKYNKSYPNLEYKTIDFNSNAISQILQDLYERKIQSLLVEGGTKLIQSFYDLNIWDEARVFVGNKLFYSGIKAPNIKGTLNEEFNYYNDKLLIFENK